MQLENDMIACRAFFVTVLAGTAYRHLFSNVKKTNYF